MTPRQTAEKTTTPPQSGPAQVSKTPTKKTPTKKAPTKKAPTTKSPTTKSPAAKKAATTKKAATAKKPATTKKTSRSASEPAPAPSTISAAPSGAFRGIAVPPGDDPWTESEALEVEHQLRLDIQRLRDEIDAANDQLRQLRVGAGGSSGEDPVDSGAKAYERETQLSIVGNAEDMVGLCEDALARLANGRYGTCETCGGPIRKLRLQAFPRASQCLPCKQRAERH